MSETGKERIQLTASHGAHISAYHARPQGKPRGGLVVVQDCDVRSAYDRESAEVAQRRTLLFFERHVG